ncbi:MAG: ABC transporter permease [Megasphaera lornae]
MWFSESIHMALTSLLANRLRSLLTMLGMIIGVAAVIIMVAIGMGVKKNITDSISGMGSNMVMLLPGSADSDDVQGAAGSDRNLTLDDAAAIAKEIPHIAHLSPVVNQTVPLVAGNKNWTTTLYGVTPDYLYIRNLATRSGLFLTADDLHSRRRVAVLGLTVAKKLFQSQNPVGQTVRISGQPYRIIGVLDSKGASVWGDDQDDVILIPLTTAQERLLGITYLQGIMMQVDTPPYIDGVQGAVINIMRQRHHIQPGQDDDFTVQTLQSIQQTLHKTGAMLTLFLGSIAAISLLGATYAAIMLQFLIESVVISVLGGLAGIAVGCLSARLLSGIGNIETQITLFPILLSFAFSVGTGIFFGLYPARKAALKDPIDALRYE